MEWKNKEYFLTAPKLIEKEQALKAFPGAIRTGLKLMRIRDLLKLDHARAGGEVK